jgi:hypothetical protein
MLQPPDKLRADRYAKFRRMGAYIESGGRDAGQSPAAE